MHALKLTSELNGEMTLEELAVEINEQHRLYELAETDTLKHGINVGNHLIRVKNKLKGRQFKPWLEKHCQFSRRQAYRYIKISSSVTLASQIDDPACRAELMRAMYGHEPPDPKPDEEALAEIKGMFDYLNNKAVWIQERRGSFAKCVEGCDENLADSIIANLERFCNHFQGWIEEAKEVLNGD